jgi:hypothetical protein
MAKVTIEFNTENETGDRDFHIAIKAKDYMGALIDFENFIRVLHKYQTYDGKDVTSKDAFEIIDIARDAFYKILVAYNIDLDY